MSPSRATSKIGDPPSDDTSAFVWLARDAIRNGNTDRALNLLELLPDENPIALSIHGQVLSEAGNFSEAVSYWTKAGDSQSLLASAQEKLSKGLLIDAQSAFLAAWKIDPTRGAYPLVDFLIDQKGDTGTAERILRQSIDNTTSSDLKGKLLLRLGTILSEQGRWEDARIVYDSILVLNRNNSQALIGLGWVEYYEGFGMNRAYMYFNDAVKAAPKRGDGFRAIGQMLDLEGRSDEASTYYERATKLSPNVPWWWIEWGNIELSSGSFLRAKRVYLQALRTFPKWAPLYYDLALAEIRLGEIDDAKQLVADAESLGESSNPSYKIRAGQVYEELGQDDKAIRQYLGALLADPSNEIARTALKRLGWEYQAP